MIKAPVIGRFFICLKSLRNAYETWSISGFMLWWWNSTGDGVWTITAYFMQCLTVVREIVLYWSGCYHMTVDGLPILPEGMRRCFMNTMEVLTLLMLVFIVLTYINDIKKWPLQTLRKFSGHLWLKNSGADRSSVAPSLCMDIIAHLFGFVKNDVFLPICIRKVPFFFPFFGSLSPDRRVSCLSVTEYQVFFLIAISKSSASHRRRISPNFMRSRSFRE